MNEIWKKAQKILKQGGSAVLPVDTMLYGLVAKASDKKAVANIYRVKGRDDGKPCIVLITKMSQLADFGVTLTLTQQEMLSKFWPGKVSVILPANNKSLHFLHRGLGSIAFRMIGKKHMRLYRLISATGPLIAPSANPQGLPPAITITEARKYFGSEVDCYVPGGKRNGLASTLVSFEKEKVNVLRQGAVKV